MKNVMKIFKALLIIVLILTSVGVVYAQDTGANTTDIGTIEVDKSNQNETSVNSTSDEEPDVIESDEQPVYYTHLNDGVIDDEFGEYSSYEADGYFFGAATTLRQVATQIQDSDLRNIPIDLTKFTLTKNAGEITYNGITAGGRFNLNCDESDPRNKDGTWIPVRVGDEFEVTYPQAIEIDGEKITLKINVTYVEGPDYSGKPDWITPEGSSYVGRQNNRIRIQNVGGKYKVVYSFYKANGQAYKFNGVVGISDPDIADILFDNTNRDLFYVDGHPDNPYTFENVDPNLWFSDWATVDNKGVHFRLLTRIDAWEGAMMPISFVKHRLFIELKNESSFTFYNDATHWDAADTIFTPYLYGSLSNKEVKENKTVNRTIRYWIGKVNGAKAFDDVKQSAKFSRTNITTSDGSTVITYGTWSPASATLNAVTSPDKTGYYPDKQSVAKENVSATSKDSVVDVIYKPYLKITTDIDNDGTITPDISNIKAGETKKVTWKPANGYYVSKVTIDNVVQTNIKDEGDSYTFDNMQKDGDVVVRTLPYYKITTEVVHGEIDKEINKIKVNENKSISYSPHSGYLLSTIEVNGENKNINETPRKYAFNKINKNYHIKVVYEKQEAPVKVVKNEDGKDINHMLAPKNSNLYYEITIKNPTATDLKYKVVDNVPEYTRFISADNGGVESNGVVTWNEVVVPAKSSKVVKMVVETTTYAKQELNMATVTVTDLAGNTITLDTNEVENFTPEPSTKAVTNDGKDINKKMQLSGNNLTYEITFKNPTTMTKHFTVTDKLPAGVRFVSADNNGQNNNNVITWSLDLSASKTKTVSVVVNILKEAEGTVLKNKATVIVDEVKDETNEVENPVLPAPVKNVYMDNEDVDKLTVDSGSLLTYKITFSNPAEERKQFVITDKIDENLVNISNITEGGVYDPNTRIITWTLDVEAGIEVSLFFDAKATGDGKYIPNTANVTVDGVNINTNTVENWTPVPPVKSVYDELGNDINKMYRLPDQILVYKIDIENNTNIAKMFKIVDELPEGVEFMTADNEGVHEDGVVTWNMQLQAEEKRTVTVHVRVTPEAKGNVLINDVTQYIDKSKIESNTVETPVLEDPVKEVLNEKGEDINKKNVSYEDVLIYKLSVYNAANDAKEFTFIDKIPENTELIDVFNEGQYDLETKKIVWTKTIQPDETMVVSYKVKTTLWDSYIPNQALVKVDAIEKETNLVENWVPKQPLKTVVDENGRDASWDWLVAQDNREITYGIHFNNPSDHEAEVIVTDVLDEAWKFLSASDNAEYDETTNTIVWKLTLPANTQDYKVSATVTPIASMSQTRLENEALVDIEEFSHRTNEVINYLVDDPTTIDLEGKKTWDDDNNAQGLRPKYIVVELKANGKTYKTQKVTGEGNEWTYRFEYLPKYMKGAEVIYTVDEYEVENYVAVIDGMNITNKVSPAPVKDVVKDSKSIDRQALEIGDTFQYTITVKNIYSEDKEYRIYDELPSGLEVVSISDEGINDLGEINWVVTVPADSEYTVSVTVKVLDKAPDVLKNQARVVVEGEERTTNIVRNPVERPDRGEELGTNDPNKPQPSPTPNPQPNPKQQTKVVNTGAC